MPIGKSVLGTIKIGDSRVKMMFIRGCQPVVRAGHPDPKCFDTWPEEHKYQAFRGDWEWLENLYTKPENSSSSLALGGFRSLQRHSFRTIAELEDFRKSGNCQGRWLSLAFEQLFGSNGRIYLGMNMTEKWDICKEGFAVNTKLR